MAKKLKLPELHCKRCEHDWTPRISDVRICPKCKSARWDSEKPVKNTSPEENQTS